MAFIAWGILLILLGGVAIGAATFTTLLSIVLLGGLLIGSGAIILIDSFHSWWSKEDGFSWNFIMGCLYCALGLLFILNPMIAAASFTLLLSAAFVVIGIAKILYAQRFKLPGWGWTVLSGFLSLLLGILIIAQWPASGLFIIGLFVGIDLIFLGWSYIMLGVLTKKSI